MQSIPWTREDVPNGLEWISTTRNAMRNFTTSKSENTTLLLLTVLDGDENSSIKPP